MPHLSPSVICELSPYRAGEDLSEVLGYREQDKAMPWLPVGVPGIT